MSNSTLISYTKLSPHHSGQRTHAIDTITIHHMAGDLSVETCGQVFQTKKASASYGIGSDGRIALYVDEANRSWASSSAANDHRAVTIEVANCSGAPDWPVSEKAYAALIELLADICRRNGIARLVWSNSKDDRVNHENGCNMTVHQDFAATACPGPYLLGRMEDIAKKVNTRLEETDGTAEPVTYKTLDDIPDYWREDIAWLVQRRYLLGDEHGDLNLSYDTARNFVVLARAIQDMGKRS